MLERINFLKEELDALRPISPDNEQRIMQKFRLDWNFHSNHLEGNSLTYGETKALILFGLTAQGKPIKDHIEITGHDEALKMIQEIAKQDFPITENFIREVNKLILKEDYESNAETLDGQPTRKLIRVGQYKSTPNHVRTRTGEIFRFAEPGPDTEAKMTDLIDWLRQKQLERTSHPVAISAQFHYQFIRIHPFDDGNGRVARILMNLILMQYGFPPVIIKTEEKRDYLFALEQADAGIFEPFLNFIIQNLERSLEIMVRGAKGESVEESDDFDKELALLEQKMKSSGKEISVFKSRTFIEDFYKSTFAEIHGKLVSSQEKFEKFYLSIDYKFGVDDMQVSKKTIPEISKIDLGRPGMHGTWIPSDFGSTQAFYYSISFRSLKSLALTRYNFNTGFSIVFNKSYYSILSYEDKEIYKDTYENLPTSEFIDNFINSEKHRHKKFIEELIDNKNK